MGVRDGLVRLAGGQVEERANWDGLNDYLAARRAARAGATQWALSAQTYGKDEQQSDFAESSAYTSNGIAFSVVRRRVDLYKQARFAFKRYGAGPKPMAADLFTSSALTPLDNPAPILAWQEIDVAQAGNSYNVMDRGKVRRLNPKWCTIVHGSEREPKDPALAWDAEPIGLIYKPPSGQAADVFLWDEVAHYAPIEDPDRRTVGMSYLRPVLAEVGNTNAYNRYITKFWENNATPNMAVTFPADTEKHVVEAYRDLFLQKHQGVDRSFRTAFLGAGADLKMIGTNLADLAAKEISSDQFAKICAAAGVPPIVVTIVPGLESASTYANYASAMRAFADFTVRGMWLDGVAALAKIIPAPSGSELWYDVSGVAALQADALDDAAVMASKAQTARTLADGGWDPDSAILAVTTGDLTKVSHTGKLSVQLQEPGTAPAGAGGQ